MDSSFMTLENLKEYRSFLVEKKDHYAALIAEIELEIKSRSSKGNPHQTDLIDKPLTPDSDSIQDNYDNMSVKELIIEVLGESKRALSNLGIRQQIINKSGREVSANGVGAQLKRNEHTVFKRLGRGKYTKWKLIKRETV